MSACPRCSPKQSSARTHAKSARAPPAGTNLLASTGWDSTATVFQYNRFLCAHATTAPTPLAHASACPVDADDAEVRCNAGTAGMAPFIHSSSCNCRQVVHDKSGPWNARVCIHCQFQIYITLQSVFSCPLTTQYLNFNLHCTTECVLLSSFYTLQSVFSVLLLLSAFCYRDRTHTHYRMCSLTTERVRLLQNVFSYRNTRCQYCHAPSTLRGPSLPRPLWTKLVFFFSFLFFFFFLP